MGLDDAVGVLATHPSRGELEEELSREDEALPEVEVPSHAVLVHRHSPHDAGEAVQHVIEGQEAVGDDHPLDG